MLSSTAGQSLAAVAAAFVAGIAVLAVSGEPDAGAMPRELPSAVATGTACSSRGWPTFEEKCQFDLRQPGHEARIVRIIAIR